MEFLRSSLVVPVVFMFGWLVGWLVGYVFGFDQL